MLKKRPVALCGGLLLIQLWIAANVPPAVFWLPAAFSLLVGVLLWKRDLVAARCWGLAALLSVLLFLRMLGQQMPVMVQAQRPMLHLSGQVVQISAEGENHHTGVLQVDQLEAQGSGFSVRCSNLPDCQLGEAVSGYFRLYPLPRNDYGLQLYAKNIWFEAEYQAEFVSDGPSPGLASRFLRLRERVGSQIRQEMEEEAGNVMVAITIGDRTQLPYQIQKTYRLAGLSHILVVSGIHLSILCGMIPMCCSGWLSRLLCALITGTLAVFWTGISGAGPAVSRACIMILLQCAGLLVGSKTDPFTDLVLAGVLLAAKNPYVVCSIGFQLSMAATLGVLCAVQWLHNTNRHRYIDAPPWFWRLDRILLQPLYVSAMALLFLAPILFFHGLSLSLGAVLGTVAAVWLLRPILVCGMLSLLLRCCFPNGFLLRGLAFISGGCIRMLNQLAAELAECTWLTIRPETAVAGLVSLMILAFLWWCFRRGYRQPTALAAAVLLLGLSWQSASLFGRDLVKITLLGKPEEPAVVVTEGPQAMVFYRGNASTAREINDFLQDHRVDTIQKVVDLRLNPPTPCPVQGVENTALTDSASHLPEWEHPLPHVQMIMTMDERGGLVGLYCGGEMVWLYSGSLEPTPAGNHLDWLIASAGDPGVLGGCRRVLTLWDHPWLRAYSGERVYYGGKGAALWLRPPIKGRIGVHL